MCESVRVKFSSVVLYVTTLSPEEMWHPSIIHSLYRLTVLFHHDYIILIFLLLWWRQDSDVNGFGSTKASGHDKSRPLHLIRSFQNCSIFQALQGMPPPPPPPARTSTQTVAALLPTPGSEPHRPEVCDFSDSDLFLTSICFRGLFCIGKIVSLSERSFCEPTVATRNRASKSAWQGTSFWITWCCILSVFRLREWSDRMESYSCHRCGRMTHQPG